MKLDKNVAKWAVNVLEISRTRRHLDRATLMVFWEKLDKYAIIYYVFIFIVLAEKLRFQLSFKVIKIKTKCCNSLHVVINLL